MANMWWLHRDASLWADPDTFNPARFMDADGEITRPQHYHPFSMGVRGCPGQAVAFMITKLVAGRLLAALRIRTASGSVPSFKPNLMLPNTPQVDVGGGGGRRGREGWLGRGRGRGSASE